MWGVHDALACALVLELVCIARRIVWDLVIISALGPGGVDPASSARYGRAVWRPSGFLPIMRFQLTDECRALYGSR
jgi:hypothetical protein